MNWQEATAWESVFNQLTSLLLASLQADEHLSLELASEQSHFVRFNTAKVRQAGTVADGSVTLSLIHNQRTAFATFPFTGNLAIDSATGLENLDYLRQEVRQLPEDPYIVLPENQGSSHEIYAGNLLSPDAAIAAILPAVQQVDFTGIYAAGTVIRAHANSAGQQHWFATETFCLDYSLITPSEKAVKEIFAGSNWQQEQYEEQIAAAKTQLEALATPAKEILPGRYRTYLAPAATAALIEMLSWGAVSEASLRQGSSGLAKLRQGKQLSPLLQISENFSRGIVPRFNESGEVAPEVLPVIANGELVNTLVNSRTAKEYNLVANGANSSESLRAPEIGTGSLNSADILSELGTGLYLANLHYLNWSDRVGGRVTGMTRYACFWVENGEFVAPIKDLRFDESLYACLGENLVGLTEFAELIPETGTYDSRQLGGCLVPGILVSDFTFTL